MEAAATTNIRPRWAGRRVEGGGCYKHAAPLEPGGEWRLRLLQTFGPAGAGRRVEGRACYKHSAPLEPGAGLNLAM